MSLSVDYFPTTVPLPCPPVWKVPNGPTDADPCPDPDDTAPLLDEAVPTPVAEAPPSPAFPVPNPAALPDDGIPNCPNTICSNNTWKHIFNLS